MNDTLYPRGISRRRFLQLGGSGMAGATLFGLTGCGGGGQAGQNGMTAWTRSVEHKYGSTELSGRPERVVTVGFNDQDPVLAMGMAPVGVREWFGERSNAVWTWAQDELGEADPAVLPAGDLNFEGIAGLEPDLILGLFSGMTEDEYDMLSEIAPTVAQPKGHPDYSVPWQEQTRITGRALGRQESSGELISDVESRFEEERREHPKFEGATGAVALLDEGGSYNVYGPQDLRGRFMRTLGFELPQKISELAGEEVYAQISRERLDLLDVDVLVWAVNSEEAADELRQSRIYTQLDVSQEGRDLFLGVNDPLAGALSFSTVLSLPYALDNLVPKLADAVDGDPATEVTYAS